MQQKRRRCKGKRNEVETLRKDLQTPACAQLTRSLPGGILASQNGVNLVGWRRRWGHVKPMKLGAYTEDQKQVQRGNSKKVPEPGKHSQGMKEEQDQNGSQGC